MGLHPLDAPTELVEIPVEIIFPWSSGTNKRAVLKAGYSRHCGV